MVFDKRASLLSVTETAAGVYEWTPVKSLWVHIEHKNKMNIFSRVGIGEKTVLFTLRKTSGVTLHNAIRVKDRFYFLTAISDESPTHWEITAAAVRPVDCIASQPIPSTDENKIRNFDEPQERLVAFPGILTEKYLGFQQETPQVRTTTTYVLVVPKSIELSTNDLVTIADVPYAVQVTHLLDEYKNEYEITRKDDV